jgi:hypothetical protein
VGNRANFGVVARRDFDDERSFALSDSYRVQYRVPSDPTATVSTGIQLINEEGRSAPDSQFKRAALRDQFKCTALRYPKSRVAARLIHRRMIVRV